MAWATRWWSSYPASNCQHTERRIRIPPYSPPRRRPFQRRIRPIEPTMASGEPELQAKSIPGFPPPTPQPSENQRRFLPLPLGLSDACRQGGDRSGDARCLIPLRSTCDTLGLNPNVSDSHFQPASLDCSTSLKEVASWLRSDESRIAKSGKYLRGTLGCKKSFLTAGSWTHLVLVTAALPSCLAKRAFWRRLFSSPFGRNLVSSRIRVRLSFASHSLCNLAPQILGLHPLLLRPTGALGRWGQRSNSLAIRLEIFLQDVLEGFD